MTVRAVIIGLILAAALASFGYANDVWMFFSYIGGDLIPTHAFGLLLIGLLVANPLLRWIGRWEVHSGEWVTILAMAFMGSVIAGSAFFWQMPHPIITPIQEQANNPGWKDKNLLQYVPDIMMVDAKVQPGEDMPAVVKDYYSGLGQRGGAMIPFGSVPWKAWAPTMTFWIGLLGLSFVGGVCAVVVVHRQWSRREHLSYPIVTFANELIEHESGRTFNPIFRNRVFWIGFAVSFLVLLINGYQKWKTSFITVPLTVPFGGLRELEVLKSLFKVPLGRNITTVTFYFSAIGLAYFLSSEVSFSLGISGWLYALAATPFVVAGQDLSTGMLEGGLPSFMWFGSYLGMGIITIYLGRRFYWAAGKKAYWLNGFTHMAVCAGVGAYLWVQWWLPALKSSPLQWSSLWPLGYLLLGALVVFAILRRRQVNPRTLGFLAAGALYGAVGVLAWRYAWSAMSGAGLFAWIAAYLAVGLACWALARRVEEPRETGESEVLPREVWAARIGMVACVGMVLLLCATGLHPLLSVAFVVLTGLLFLMLTRVHAATGLFLIQPTWHPVTVLLALFGSYALGPQTLIVLALLCTVITLDPRIAMMPLVANALKLGDNQKVAPGRLAGWMAVAIVAALAIGMIATVYLVYDRGVNTMDSGGTSWAIDVAKMPFQMLENKAVTPLDSTGQLAEAAAPVTIDRLFDKAKLTPNFLTATGIGLGLVLLCSFLRLRFSRWPLHPVMFLVWGQGWMIEYAPSFLLAWALKSVIMQYGGQKTYYRARGFFVGLVAGEFVAALLWAAVGVTYYVQTGKMGESFLVRP